MGVVRSKVEFSVDERRAKRAAGNIKREMNAVEREAKDAERAVDKARAGGGGATSRFNRLLGRAKTRGIEFRDEDVTLGERFKLSRSGLSLRSTYTQGKSSGFEAGALRVGFGAMIAGNAAGSVLNSVADYKEAIEEFEFDSANIGELYSHAYKNVMRGAVGTFGGEAILRGALRLSGVDSGVIDESFDMTFNIGGKTETDAAIEQQAASRRKFMKAQQEMGERRAKAESEAEAKRQDALEKAMEKIDQTLAERLSKIRVTKLPIRVSDQLFMTIMHGRRAIEHGRSEDAEKNLTAGAGS